jgi:hypothetical protein
LNRIADESGPFYLCSAALFWGSTMLFGPLKMSFADFGTLSLPTRSRRTELIADAAVLDASFLYHILAGDSERFDLPEVAAVAAVPHSCSVLARFTIMTVADGQWWSPCSID